MANSTTNIDTISQSQAAKEATANAFFDAVSQAALFGRRASTTSGLTWGYYGGNFTKSDGTMTQVANGTLTLSASTTNYITVLRSTGVVYCNTDPATAWNDNANYRRLYSVVTGTASVTSYTDSREPGQFSAPRRIAGPTIKTGNFTWADTEDFIVCNGTASITATLPDPVKWAGRELNIKTIAAYTVVASTGDVKPLATNTPDTAILAATAGKWARMVSDGTYWVVMAAG